MAKQVVRASRQPRIQRQEGGEEALQASPYADSVSDFQRSATPLAAGIGRVQRTFVAPPPDFLSVQRDEVEEEMMQAKPLEESGSQLPRTFVAPPPDFLNVQRAAMGKEVGGELMQAVPNHGVEGGDVDTDVARSIQSAKGSGQPLEERMRSSMEQGFGADFSGVRVHTGGQADALNRSLNAKAFTTGNDIFFGRGQYNPGSSGGQELIAHELTHTVQQGAAPVGQVQASRRTKPDASTPTVQRFITREAAIKLGGAPSRKATMKNSGYVQILNLLDAYENGGNKTEILGELIALCKTWLNSHGAQSVRGTLIQGLQQEAEVREPQGGQLGDSTSLNANAPSVRASAQEAREAGAAIPDWANPALKDTQADKYIFTIAVATKFDDLLDFAKARAQSTKRNKVRGALTKTPLFGIRGSKKAGQGDTVIKKGFFKLAAPKSNQAIKEKAAREVLESKKEEVSPDAIASIADRSSDVGHTWVKFRTMVGNETKEVYSYGMWPEVGYGHPAKAVAGRVRHPDVSHEQAPGEKQLFMDVEVSAKAYNKGLAQAIRRLQEKPNYTLSDYNCTAFAKEIAGVVGVSFPKAATVFPAEASKGFRQSILSPNRLFSSMEAMKNKKGGDNIRETSSTLDVIKQAHEEEESQRHEEEQRRMEQELSAHTQYDVVFSVDFWPGEQFGDEMTVRFGEYGGNQSVWGLGVEKQFYNPDTEREETFTKVKAPIGDQIRVGWIRTDALEPAN
ncbi:MAG: DUF4157 domain-containing protein [Caldilineaceae bacterium]|nr:DUF4157 domain-containing protein [Caldilineaceae bacterium]